MGLRYKKKNRTVLGRNMVCVLSEGCLFFLESSFAESVGEILKLPTAVSKMG